MRTLGEAAGGLAIGVLYGYVTYHDGWGASSAVAWGVISGVFAWGLLRLCR